jgi:FkbM family methyltransferase
MIHRLTQLIRDKYHPLYKLRQNQFFVNKLMPALDIPIWCRLHGVSWPVKVRLIRHLSYILNSRIHEPGIAAVLVTFNRTIGPKVFWDIGAHIGYYSWLMHSLNHSIETVMFEPDPDHAALVSATILKGKLKHAKVFAFAVSDCPGTAEFALDKSSGATGTLAITENFNLYSFGWMQEMTIVQTVSLDQIQIEQNLAAPDLIKIDVELCEHLVFRGAKRLLAEAQPIIIFECAAGNRPECFTLLEQLRYKIYSADEPNGPLETAINFLALPEKYSDSWTDLSAQWKLELEQWII